MIKGYEKMSSISIKRFEKHYMKCKIKDDDIFYGAEFEEKTGAFITTKISTSEVGYDIEILGFNEIEHHNGPNVYLFSYNDKFVGRIHRDLIEKIEIKTI